MIVIMLVLAALCILVRADRSAAFSLVVAVLLALMQIRDELRAMNARDELRLLEGAVRVEAPGFAPPRPR